MQRRAFLCMLACTACARGASDRDVSLDDVPRLTVAEQMRIGSVDDPDAGFSQIGGVQVAPNGETFVLERMAREVRVFDAQGKKLRTIGRQGAGPGEFQSPIRMGLMHDTLWVHDTRNARISWFRPDGTLLFDTPTRVSVTVDVGVRPGIVRVSPYEPRPDGFIASALGISAMPGAPPLPDSFPVPNVRFDRSGNVVDTAGWTFQQPPARTASTPNIAFFLRLPPRPPIRVLSGTDTIVITWSVDEQQRGSLDIIRLAVLPPREVPLRTATDTVFRRRFAYSPHAVTTSYTDSIVNFYAEMHSREGRVARGEIEQAVRAALVLPPFLPPIGGSRVGADGALWLSRPGSTADSTAWIVIDARGDVRGHIQLPTRATVSWSDSHTIWTVQPDESDVPWLVKLAFR
jgi:hypothetical protein